MKVRTQTIRTASLLIGDYIVPEKARRNVSGLVIFQPDWRVKTIQPCPTDRGRTHLHVNLTQCYARVGFVTIVERADYDG